MESQLLWRTSFRHIQQSSAAEYPPGRADTDPRRSVGDLRFDLRHYNAGPFQRPTPLHSRSFEPQ
jgi:hypothetical protein